MALKKRKKQKISMPSRKSKTSKLIEEKHIGVEVTNWADLDPKDYDKSVFWTLRHYGYFYDIKDAFKWATKWVKENRTKEELKFFKSGPERNFSMTAGGLCRMLENGATLDDRKMSLINREVDKAIERGRLSFKEEVLVDIPKKSPADIVRERTSDFIAGIEEKIDAFEKKAPEDYNIYDELMTVEAPYNMAKGVADYYTPLYEELKLLVEKKDPELVEGYSWMGVRARKQFMLFVKSIIDDADRYMMTKKAGRKTRKPKVKTASQQVSSMKYLPESKEHKIASIDPTNIVGMDEVYLYNTKYDQIHYLKSNSKKGFEVKGTTIQNVDLELSFKKKVRKPEEFLVAFMKAPKVKSRKLIEALTTKGAQTNGRVNDKTILMKGY